MKTSDDRNIQKASGRKASESQTQLPQASKLQTFPLTRSGVPRWVLKPWISKMWKHTLWTCYKNHQKPITNLFRMYSHHRCVVSCCIASQRLWFYLWSNLTNDSYCLLLPDTTFLEVRSAALTSSSLVEAVQNSVQHHILLLQHWGTSGSLYCSSDHLRSSQIISDRWLPILVNSESAWFCMSETMLNVSAAKKLHILRPHIHPAKKTSWEQFL